MKLIHIATSNVNQTPLDWNGNLERLLRCISQAQAKKVSLLCLPELAITGYGCEDQFLAPATTEQALESLEKLTPCTKGIAVAVGLPLRHQNAIYNTVAMIADGDLLGFYANLLGNEAGRIIYDGGSMIASNGNLVAQGERFSFHDTNITTAVVDLDLHRLSQAKTASRHIDLNGFTAIQTDFDWPIESHPTDATEVMPADQYRKEVEFTRAVTLGLFDYMRKSHSKGFVISLSGGTDSAAVACLVALMFQIVEQQLRPADWQRRMNYLGDKIPELKDLLICIYQATENSGDCTRKAAATLAQALGAEYAEWQVQDTVDQYIGLAEKTIGRPLTWEKDDITLQNIQARVRAPGVWMLANIRNALLLATSNRSEAAVGYATMDGDTCGGLSPIAGIDKAFLRHWLRWLEKEGAAGITAIPALKVVNEQQPTAELRPTDQRQSDEGDLMPYPILDQIERWAIRDKKAPAEVYQLLIHRFADYQPDTLKKYVIHFFRLWSRNQWKRERYAPSFHLDDENLDPKTWCRFPILNAGFKKELQALEQTP